VRVQQPAGGTPSVSVVANNLQGRGLNRRGRELLKGLQLQAKLRATTYALSRIGTFGDGRGVV